MAIKRVKKERDEIHFEFGPAKFEVSLVQIVCILAVIGLILWGSLNMRFDYKGKRVSFGCQPVELPKK